MKKFITAFLCVLFSLTILVSVGIYSLLGNTAQKTVVKTIKSPNEAHYAQVVVCDQGALGGNTLVYVFDSKPFIFKIKKLPEKLYQGQWGEHEYMQIYWKNDNCIVINSTEYTL